MLICPKCKTQYNEFYEIKRLVSMDMLGISQIQALKDIRNYARCGKCGYSGGMHEE